MTAVIQMTVVGRKSDRDHILTSGQRNARSSPGVSLDMICLSAGKSFTDYYQFL